MSYQLVNLQPLNSGGNGDLYIGQRSDNGERVVLKYLREFHLTHARKAFEREIRMLARGLPGLVPLLFCDTNAKRPFYVMPYLTGGSLAAYAGKLTDDQLYLIAEELARTLANLHASFEAHGDVKPDNLLVTQDGRLQVADPLGNGTVFTIVFSANHGGTPGYWAPEISTGGSISRAGDMYSYGATMYHLQTGRRPQDRQQIDPTSVGCWNAPKLREIIRACCQIDPGTRPTMQEVLRVLGGERWANIQAARKQQQDLVKAACAIACIVLLGAVVTS
jgi:serine/threonine protein kinase